MADKEKKMLEEGNQPMMQAEKAPVQGMPMENAPALSGEEKQAISAQALMDAMAMQKKRNNVGIEQIREANMILLKYKNGRAKMEQRLVENEKWWEGRAWDQMDEGNKQQAKHPTKWLFNVIMGKHADMVEAYPEPSILPREKNDEAEAKALQSIIPVILKRNGYEETYNRQAWDKNKSGIVFTAVTWDASKLNGLGDISIAPIDPLNLFWEPGLEDLQKSRHLFYVTMQDREALKEKYPQLGDMRLGSTLHLTEYDTTDKPNNSDKAAVIDWYYHKYKDGKRILHYCKYCGETILFASENEPEWMDRGWYDDGDYPFIEDPLFLLKNHVDGLGYIDIGKDAQESIDVLDQAVVTNAKSGAIPRWLVSDDANINEQEYADHTKPFIHVSGPVTEANIMPVQHNPLSGIFVQVLNNKIEEMKQTTGNQDVNNGATGGVTAASAIAALQESAGRSSKDGIKGTYRAYARMIRLVISRIRQFYDAPRTFRITGDMGEAQYIQYNNAGLQMQLSMIPGMGMTMRLPEFDIEVGAQKQNVYTKMAQNELALQLLNAGVFNPQLADQSMMLLDMMDFNGKDKLLQKIQQNAMLIRQMAMWQQMAITLAQKYGDPMADQLAMGVMAQAGLPMQTPQVDPRNRTDETGKTPEGTKMQNARAQAQQASQPE